MGDEAEGAFLGKVVLGFQPFAEDIAPDVEPQVLAHSIERGLGIEGRTVAGAADIVEGRTGRRGDFPDVEPEAALEDAAVEVEAVGGALSD